MSEKVEFLRDGSEILTPFKMDLQSALLTGMAEGVVSAISVCAMEAPAIASSQSTGNILVGRTSHKLRNPDNEAPIWAQDTLDRYVSGDLGFSPQVVEVSEDRVGYLEPIIVQAVCLNCHGSQIAEPVVSELHRYYPDDQATGFELGDFRGLFWVEMDRP